MTHILTDVGFVSQEHQRVAELVNEYDPTLQLLWIPPDKREFDEQFPFAILHSPSGKVPYIVRKVQIQDMNETLIAWLYQSERIGDVNAYQDGLDMARKALNDKAIEESKGAILDFAQSVIKGKHWYKHNGKVYS